MEGTVVIAIVVGVALGLAVGYYLNTLIFKRKNEELNRKADTIIEDARISAKHIVGDAELKAKQLVNDAELKAKNLKEKYLTEAREKVARLKEELDRRKKSFVDEVREKEEELTKRHRELKTLEEELESRRMEIEAIRKNLAQQLEIVSHKKAELEKLVEEHIAKLENIARLKESEAREQLLESVKAKITTEAMALEKRIIEEATQRAHKEAKKIVIQTIQRLSADYTIENTISVFHLDSDDIKGQIIGREGRNIRALEKATGAEIIVDDTPETIVISSFDPVRREVCRQALKILVADGRIHPTRIEEVVSKVKKQLDEQIVEIGERTVIDLNIEGLHPNLVKMVGRMRFRSSYGQNLLQHSIETAHLCAIMAAELGLSPKQVRLAKRAGLLHDIGKVSEENSELSHALLGMEIARNYDEHPAVVNAIGAHHDEIEMNNIISPIVQACDAISGARPGARREILENYLKRIRELEQIALEFEGVQKAYALQAGRELRVIVESDKIDDKATEELSFMISKKIENEMQYPGQVKVTVIREIRATAFAK